MTKTSQLYCGAARGRITPEESLLPDLRALRDDRFGGVLDDIYVRVIAIGDGQDTALIVAFELDKAPYPEENLRKISDRTGIPQENIFYFSTHLHTAPVTGVRPEEPPNDISRKAPEVQAATAEYERQVLATLHEVVDEAIASMQPARMGYANGESYINVSRNQIYEYVDEKGKSHREYGLGVDPAAPIDRTLFTLRLEDMDGKPLAFFINYPVHNCVVIGNDFCDGKIGVGGDLSGAVSRALEEEYEGSTVIWSSGAAGDVNPVMLNEMYYPDPKTGQIKMGLLGEGAATALVVLAGRHLADARKAMSEIECSIDSASIAGTVAWSLTPGCNTVKREDGSVEVEAGEGVDPYEIRLHLVRVGDLALLGFSGELYSSLGAQVKEASPLENTVLINHDASLMARSHYIFDDKTSGGEMACVLPGVNNSHLVPGHVAASLQKHTQEMFEALDK